MSARGKKGSKRGKEVAEGVVMMQQTSSTSSLAPAAASAAAAAMVSGGSSSSTMMKTVTMTTSSSSSGASIKNTAVNVNGGGATSSSSFSSSSSSNVSPSRLGSRIQEKEELQTLNDRFANYIERARNLEAENMQLSVQLANAKELHTQEVTSLKFVFESQLEATQKQLADSEARSAALEIDVKKWRSDAEAVGVKITRVEADNAALTKRLSKAEAEVASLTERLNAALAAKAAAVEESGSWRLKFGEAEKQLVAIRGQMEDGILAKAALENQLRAVKEELQFKKTVLQVDSSNLSVSTLISSEASVNIELKLQESLKGLREHYDARAAALKAELQAMYKAQLQGLSVASESSLVSFESGSEADLAAKDARISALLLQINELQGQLQMSQGKVASLEKEMAGRDAKHAAAVALKDKQIGELQSQVGDFMKKYNDLKNLHLAMEVEVEAYGQLLANEESRLKINPSAAAAKRGGSSRGKANLQQELRQLNDRFAIFIEENLKNMAAEKVQLTMELQTIEVKHQKQLAAITGNYELRLAETQKLLDDALKLKAHLEVEVQKLKDRVKELTGQLNKATSEASALAAKLKATEKDLAVVTAKYEALLKEKQVGLDALAKYKAELAELQLSFSAMRKELEMANLAKANLETEMASFQRDSEASKTMYDAELKELRMKTEFEMSEMDDSALIESDARLEKSLHDLRRHFEQRAAAMRLEMQSKYEGKINELQGALAAAASVGVKSTEVTITSDAQVKALTLQVDDLKQKLKAAEGRYVTLQKAMQAKETAFQSALAAKDADLQKIQAQLSEKMLDLRELMNLKMTLDLELAAYDKMLIAEEEMFGVVNDDAKASKKSPAKKTDTLVKGYSKAVALLKSLNDRFASYVELVQKLRAANQLLEVKVQKVEENATREIASLKGLYEAELADARVLIDQTAKEKAQLQIEVGKWTAKADDLAAQLAALKAELAAAKKALKAAEAKIADLTSKLAAALKDKQEAVDELKALKVTYGELESQLLLAKKQLEQETVVRVDLENRLQSIKEELVFKKSMFDAELNQSRSRLDLSTEIVVPDAKESKIHEYLRDLRQQNDSQSSALRQELTAIFESKCGGLGEVAVVSTPAVAATSDAEITMTLKINELNMTIGDLQTQLATMQGRLTAAEAEAAAAEASLRAVIDEKEGMIGQLQKELATQLAEYHELLDVKLALDLEIAAYRKLLEGEEERLSTSRSPTPTRAMKRKRASHVITASSSSLSTAASVHRAIDAASDDANADADYQVQTKSVKLTTAAAPIAAASSSSSSSFSASFSPSTSASTTTTKTTRRLLSSGLTPTSGATAALADSSAGAASSSSSTSSYTVGSRGSTRGKTVVHKTVVVQQGGGGETAAAAEDNKNCVLM